MRDIGKLGGLLLLITTIAATALAGIYNVTKPRIEAQKALELDRALTIALPAAPREAIFPVQANDDILYYVGYKTPEKKELIGYAFVSHGPGYSSLIETMVGVDSLGAILGMKVLNQVETPGLGTKVEETRHGEGEPWFTQQFLRKPAGQLAVDKDGGDIQSITGATISSRAVVKSVVAAYEKLLADRVKQD
ncbi:RnfABCDGE type electron transport complex subunit G [candidate division KSB1 bacterium]|nr:RnfABCDGE type electron transport complex subunit G [candidate division KSB1 bacterium]